MAGMDPKILAAVFASIAAIAVGTGGSGSLDNFQGINPQNMIGEFTNSPSGIADVLGEMNRKPVPNNSVTVEASLNSGNADLSVNSDALILKHFSTLISQERNITSDEAVTFHDYSGDLTFSTTNMTRIDGTYQGFSSSGVNVASQMRFTGGTDAGEIKLENISRQAMVLQDVDAKISSKEDSTVIERGSTSLNINSFSGEITFYSENASIIMKGEVDEVKAGGTTYSG